MSIRSTSDVRQPAGGSVTAKLPAFRYELLWPSSPRTRSRPSASRSTVRAIFIWLASALSLTDKSHGASRAVAWWLDTRDDPFATTTAPTTKQVHAILWRYIGQAHRKGNLPGRITLDDEWYMGPGGKELVAFGRKPADHDQSAFQGIHALNPLILVDEACGVPKSIFDAVDALATNSNARVLAIGNPDDPVVSLRADL